ncbi:MAG: hypothetical protein HYU38_01605 [Candidatus Tectomicrobia bacterium]|nr:hypothetical protein [Candidatus Tectomicrobia bacterium]
MAWRCSSASTRKVASSRALMSPFRLAMAVLSKGDIRRGKPVKRRFRNLYYML